jgi:hypothetical protein
MLSAIRNTVVNKRIVGKLDIDSVSSAYKQLNRIDNATIILNVINISKKIEGIGIMNKTIAKSK